MTHNENLDDLWLQTAARHLKVQISHSDMWAADVCTNETIRDNKKMKCFLQ